MEPRLGTGWLTAAAAPSEREIRARLGNGIAAARSVPTALFLALQHGGRTFDDLASAAIRLGGDVDTILAMAGAVWGIWRGSDLPAVAIEQRERIAAFARQLCQARSRWLPAAEWRSDARAARERRSGPCWDRDDASSHWRAGARSSTLSRGMIDQTFRQIVDSLGARTPTPGGGAAAAMSACLGTALFLMVVRFSQGKKQNADREQDLAQAERLLQDHLERLLPMADRDCRSYDLVLQAYGMPKETSQQQAIRSRAVQEAMRGAMVVPEETLCMVRDVFHAMASVRECIGKAIVSDLASGASLLLAAAEGAYLNVRINAIYLEDRQLAGITMDRVKTVRDEIRNHQQKIATAVDEMLA